MTTSSETTDLESKRVEVAQRLAALRPAPEVSALVQQADAAIAKHRAETSVLERQLDEIDSQLGIRVRQQREEAERQRQDEVTGQRKELVGFAEEDAQDVAGVERDARSLAAGYVRILERRARMAKLHHALTHQTTPAALGEHDTAARLSQLLSAVMQTIRPRHRQAFGGIMWPSSPRASSDSWSELEGRLVASVLQSIITKKDTQ